MEDLSLYGIDQKIKQAKKKNIIVFLKNHNTKLSLNHDMFVHIYSICNRNHFLEFSGLRDALI